MKRRDFLRYSASIAGTSVAGFTALGYLNGYEPRDAAADTEFDEATWDYGPLNEAGPELALPEGFRYRRMGIANSPMSDGNPTPGAHDGMAAFPLPNGNIRLIRNHEIVARPPTAPLVQPTYDVWAGGGTTSLEINPTTRAVIRDFVSLSGTVRNCAGGRTPWGSWLSCEETVIGPAQGARQAHGYVFDVSAAAEAQVEPIALKAMGRFVHEAVAVDPLTGIVYETEDYSKGGFYQFLPEDPHTGGRRGDLTAGGRLQMLAIRDRPNYDCSTGQTAGQTLETHWVDIDDPDPAGAAANPSAVFDQGARQGAARFSRVEGCWFGEGRVYFSSTDGGNATSGQIWEYRAVSPTEGILTLIFESPGVTVLNRPDNICVSPRGGVVLCEDGLFGHQFVRGLTPQGKIFDFAKNIANDSEFAGATYSPDGQTLFVNTQWNPGATYAIWGPWERGAL